MLPPLFADLLALVLALDAADSLPLVAAIAALLVIADAVVDVGEGDVAGDVALILAVEARQRGGDVDVIGIGIRGMVWGQRRQVGAGSGAGLVRAVGAVAVVVVELREGEGDGRAGDAGELLGVFVKLCNCRACERLAYGCRRRGRWSGGGDGNSELRSW